MRGKGSGMTRREFLYGATGTALAGTVLGLGASDERGDALFTPPRGDRSRVVLVRHESAVAPDGTLNAPVLESMLDEAVTALTGAREPAAAWKSLVRPQDIVGIKSNVWRFLPTPPEINQALRRRVISAGVPGDRVSVDDRGILHNPVFREATALINVRPLRTHHWAGVGSLIKNYIMFVEEPSEWHGDSCANLAGLWDLPMARGKTRLNVLVMLTPLFHSKGPHAFSAKYTWPYGGLLVGTDPVAVDATGLRILQAKRRDFFGRERAMEVPPKHIELAETRFGLGAARPERIDLVRLGRSAGTLI